MKKVLVCALAALFLMASCVNAFAAATYTTTTTYITDDSGEKLKVTTNVTDVDEGTMVTYLAYKEATPGEGPTDSNIKFIDQKTADSTGVKFEYTTAKDNLTGVTVKSGSNATDQTGMPYTEDESNRVRTITVTCGDDSDTITLPTATTASVITTKIAVKENYTLETATFTATGSEAPTDIKSSIGYTGSYITITDSAALTGNGAIAITVAAPVLSEATVSDVIGGHFNGFEDGLPVNKMTVFGKAGADIASVNEPTKEWTGKTVKGWGGIVVLEIKPDDTATTVPKTAADLVANDSAVVYPAHYRGADGSFAVQLVDKVSKISESNMYACIYVVSTDGAVTYGDVIHFAPITDTATQPE